MGWGGVVMGSGGRGWGEVGCWDGETKASRAYKVCCCRRILRAFLLFLDPSKGRLKLLFAFKLNSNPKVTEEVHLANHNEMNKRRGREDSKTV